MNFEEVSIMRNLGVIGALTENDKINTKTDIFSVHNPTHMRAIHRTFYGENRQHNIQHVCALVKTAKQIISTQFSEHNLHFQSMSISKEIAFRSSIQGCVRMWSALQSALKGLKALTITYKDDAATVTQLEIILNDIDDFLIITKEIVKAQRHDHSLQLVGPE